MSALTWTEGRLIFIKPSLYSIMALWGACMEGFNLTIPGNIISNQGFINQFGALFLHAAVPFAELTLL